MGKLFESKPSYQRGLVGEEVVEKFLTSHGCTVRRPKDKAPSGSSLVDFVLNAPTKNSLWKGKELVEVKVKTTMDYSYGRFPVYVFPVSQVENYRRYAAEKNLCLNIFIVDSDREQIFWRDLNQLEMPLRIEEKTFPADVEQTNGLHRYYHVNQFVPVARPNFADLERLWTIKLSAADKKTFRPLKNSTAEISDEDLIAASRDAALKILDVRLPDDLPSTDEKLSAFVNALRPKIKHCPTYFFREIYHVVGNLDLAEPMPAFVKKFYALLDEIKSARLAASYEPPYIFRPETPVKKFSELHAPNDTTIEIFAPTHDATRSFAQMFQLAEAVGCDTQGLIHSNFGNAIKAAARFYTLTFGTTDKKISAVAVKDVAKILREYFFYREEDVDKCTAAKNFLAWWNRAAAYFLE